MSLPAWEKLPPLRRCYVRLLDPGGDAYDVWQNHLEAELEGLNEPHRKFSAQTASGRNFLIANAPLRPTGTCVTRSPTLTADCWRNSKSLGSPKVFGVRVGKRHMGTTMISYSARRVQLSPGEGR